MPSANPVTSRKRTGRPPKFERASALRAAMLLFWERGFEGTSFDDLISAMGISASSFYNSFKSKGDLYREATDAYLAESGVWFSEALSGARSAKDAFARMLEAGAEQYTRSDRPAGCMISLAGTHVPPDLDSIRALMSRHRHVAEEAMATRIREAVTDGELPAAVDIDELAAFYHSVARGMAVQARDGAGQERLIAIAKAAMRAWPTS